MRRELLYLEDLALACKKIARFLEGKTYQEFAADELLFDATVRNLQIIGEAVRSLPEEVRQIRPDVGWSRIVGLRNLIIHQYFGIDDEIVWDLASKRCPELLIVVEGMISTMGQT